MKRELAMVSMAAFVAFSVGAVRGDYGGPCDWKLSDVLLPGCSGANTLCNTGCNTACAGFDKVEYFNPKSVISGGSYQKTEEVVVLACKKNKTCENYAIGGRECKTDAGAPHCNTVNANEFCGYCSVAAENIVPTNGYNVRSCPPQG